MAIDLIEAIYLRIEHEGWRLTSREKLVWITLANACNYKRGDCVARIGSWRLGRKIGTSRSNVFVPLKKLEKLGLIRLLNAPLRTGQWPKWLVWTAGYSIETMLDHVRSQAAARQRSKRLTVRPTVRGRPNRSL